MTIGETAKQQYFRMLDVVDPDFRFEIACMGWEETYARYDEAELQRRYYMKVRAAGQELSDGRGKR